MIIKNSEEPLGATIDCGIHGIHPNRYRASIRKVGENEWLIEKYMFKTRTDVPDKRGTLKEIVRHLNMMYGTKDVAED